MALTASAQSALPFSWDETIVPALRKRLESESRMLAKRMSTASITSQEEAYPHSSNLDTLRDRNAIGSGRNGSTPRPTNGQSKQATNGNTSLTHQRTDTAGSTSSHVDVRGPKRRARTYSQPPIYDGPLPNGHPPGSNGVVVNGLPTPDASRSTSPLHQQQQAQGRPSDVKPTRIPIVSRNRTPSESSHGTQHGRSIDASRNVPYLSQPGGELSAVEESLASNRARSAVSGQRSAILNESTPTKPGSMKSNVSIRREQRPAAEDETEPRPSTDSEERPFEHWYRGDVRRNGGVGELRVGGKQEMLDIANYGHKYGAMHKPSTIGPASFRTTPSTEDFATRRHRAGSFTEGEGRESFYMDEERARALDNVLHEDPLTDLEGDGDNYSYDYVVPSPILPVPSSSPDDHRSVTPTNNQSIERERNAPQTRIPGPAPRQSSELPRTQTPAEEPHRSGSEPAPLPSSSSSATANAPGRAQSSRSQSAPPSQPQPQTPKRRAKSPAAPSASKKAKQASKSPARSKADLEKNRRSVANYPQPTGDNVVDAIPSWTQPVPADGNWDEVVLPVVARKRGLDGHYAQADGRAQSKEPESEPIEPAPGMFAYDHSKHRPREINGIPMYEFSQRPQDINIPEVEEEQAQSSRAWNDDTRPAYVRPQRSPVPTPHHANKGKENIPKIRITQPTFDMEQQQQNKDKDDAGCCKCVIM